MDKPNTVKEAAERSGAARLSEAWHPSERDIGTFMYGGCAALALALHNATKLPMVALVEPEGEDEHPVHIMLKYGDRYLDINGLRTYQEVIADCRDEHECTTDQWSLISATPRLIQLWTHEGYLDPVHSETAKAIPQIVQRMIAAYDLPVK
jgi:hypothetical protein